MGRAGASVPGRDAHGVSPWPKPKFWCLPQSPPIARVAGALCGGLSLAVRKYINEKGVANPPFR